MKTTVTSLVLFGASFAFASHLVDLTPPEPLPLGGYTERKGAKFVSGPERQYALVSRVGGRIVVNLEMLTVPESLCEAVQQRVGKPVLLVATHTHCAPDSQMLNRRMTLSIPGIANFSKKWFDWYVDRITVAAKLAVNDPEPSNLKWGQVSLPLARSRRRHSVPDNTLTMIDGDWKARIYGAHPTLFDEKELRLQGDWPGVLIRHDFQAFTGAIGAASPIPPIPLATPDQQVAAFGQAVLGAVPSRWNNVDSPAKWCDIPIELPKPTPHPNFARDNGIPEPLAQSVVARFAPESAKLSLLALGGLLVIFVPGEPTAELSRAWDALAKRSGFRAAATISHAGGWIGYLLSPKDYNAGGYEANLSLWGPEIQTNMNRAVAQGLKQLTLNQRSIR